LFAWINFEKSIENGIENDWSYAILPVEFMLLTIEDFDFLA
jgi:hypothetical protein